MTRNDDGSGYQNIGSWAMPSEQWTHITTVFRKDNDSKEIYANGELVDSASALFGWIHPATSVRRSTGRQQCRLPLLRHRPLDPGLVPRRNRRLHATEAASTLPNYVPTDGLVAYYPLDGNATDGSANNHDGVQWSMRHPHRIGLVSRTWPTVSPETSRIQLPNVSVAGDLSVSFWFKAENGSDGSDAILSSSARFFRLVDISPDEWLIGYNAICPV